MEEATEVEVGFSQPGGCSFQRWIPSWWGTCIHSIDSRASSRSALGVLRNLVTRHSSLVTCPPHCHAPPSRRRQQTAPHLRATAVSSCPLWRMLTHLYCPFRLGFARSCAPVEPVSRPAGALSSGISSLLWCRPRPRPRSLFVLVLFGGLIPTANVRMKPSTPLPA